MLARKLENSPTAEELPIIAAVMAGDLADARYGDEHAARVAAAFDFLGRTQSRWPTPADVIQRLHQTAPRAGFGIIAALPAPKNLEVAQRHIQRLREGLAIQMQPPYDKRKRGRVSEPRSELTPECERELLAAAEKTYAPLNERKQEPAA